MEGSLGRRYLLVILVNERRSAVLKVLQLKARLNAEPHLPNVRQISRGSSLCTSDTAIKITLNKHDDEEKDVISTVLFFSSSSSSSPPSEPVKKSDEYQM